MVSWRDNYYQGNGVNWRDAEYQGNGVEWHDHNYQGGKPASYDKCKADYTKQYRAMHPTANTKSKSYKSSLKRAVSARCKSHKDSYNRAVKDAQKIRELQKKHRGSGVEWFENEFQGNGRYGPYPGARKGGAFSGGDNYCDDYDGGKKKRRRKAGPPSLAQKRARKYAKEAMAYSLKHDIALKDAWKYIRHKYGLPKPTIK